MRVQIATLAALVLSACATGPRRQALAEYVVEEPPMEEASLKPSMGQEEEPPVPAGPFSVGLMMGAGLSTDGGHVIPAQLAVGTAKVLEVKGRALQLMALGGVSQTAVSRAHLSWGFGLGLQLTPEALAYEVDLGLGPLWLKGEDSPAIVLGFVLTPKM